MLANYLKIAIRNLTRNRLYTGLNLLGLVAGMAACLLILQYVSYEWSYDRFHHKADNIYRVINDRYQSGKRVQIGTITYPAVGPLIDEDYPEVVNHTRLFYQGSTIIHREKDMLRSTAGYFVDNEFLNLFSFELLAGDRSTALKEPRQILLTEKVARHFFDISDGDYDKLIGQNILLNQDEQPYQVTGILADIPENSLLQPDILGSYATLGLYMGAEAVDKSLRWSDFYHYLEVRPGTDIAVLERKLEDFSKRHFKGEEVSGAEEHFYLQPLTEAHLNSMHLEYEIGEVGSGRVVWALLIIALFIIALAWVNYINLSSVRAIERAKEVGIRKVVGARRGQLVRQFLTEAALVNSISLALAGYLAYMAAPLMNARLGVNLSWQYLFSGDALQATLIAALAGWLLLGILFSGLYPAFLLGRQQTPLVLKG
ncbi:MAG: ABC transporter permease, partial [Phaeodactylibacter sp.]|nr:ABC transporter permease [Phaeodactylibacter sp.]